MYLFSVYFIKNGELYHFSCFRFFVYINLLIFTKETSYKGEKGNNHISLVCAAACSLHAGVQARCFCKQ